MNIHLYVRDFPAHSHRPNGGLDKAVHGLAAGLAGCGASVTVLCQGPQGIYRRTEHGYDLRCFAVDRNPPGHFEMAEGLRRYISSGSMAGDGLAILNGIFHTGVSPVARLLGQHGIPYIAAPHDPYHPAIFRTHHWRKLGYWYLLERPMLRHAVAVQVLDQRHGAYLRQYGVATPVIEVPNGFEASEVPPESSLSWDTRGVPRLHFLGRLDAHNKGLDILLRAFAEVATGIDASLTIQGPDWGDGPMLQEQAVALGLGGKVAFARPDFDVAPTLLTAQHDILCLPSRFEGFGLAALEAMLAGRVLLVSDVAGIAPHVRAAGCGLVVSADVGAVRDGLLQLMAMRCQWREMGLRGRCYALEHLSWDRIAPEALAQYRRILSPVTAAAQGSPPAPVGGAAA